MLTDCQSSSNDIDPIRGYDFNQFFLRNEIKKERDESAWCIKGLCEEVKG